MFICLTCFVPNGVQAHRVRIPLGLNSLYTFYFEIAFIFNGVRDLNLFSVILFRYARSISHNVVFFTR